MTTNRAYLVIPKLIEQPTWGGNYIMRAKSWQKHPLSQKLIGQSYELYSGSYLSLTDNTKDSLFQGEFTDIPENAFSIDQLVNEDPLGLLGTRGSKKYDGQLKTLIKFTQGKGNSFQLHVKKPDGMWIPKPESWYFFENGYATLGIKNKKKVNQYKKTCLEIEEYMKLLSAQIVETGHAPSLRVDEARKLAQKLIKQQKIYQYVNVIEIPKDSIVDLHFGGIHHAWEEDDTIAPNGNILYEVQVDSPDNVSTLRSFDKGKIQDDGTIRPLQIEEYFAHLDTSVSMNDPEKLITQPQSIQINDHLSLSSIFATDFYTVDELTFSGTVDNEYTRTENESFHHYFVKNGTVDYHDSSVDLHVTSGHSFFIPAHVETYTLQSKGKGATVIKTYV